jgi:hypothetical protein
VNLADHGVAGHVTEFRSDLAGGKAAFPEFLQLFDAIVGPCHYRHRRFPFVSAGLTGQRCELRLQKSLRSESFSAHRARISRPAVTPHWMCQKDLPPHEMSYPTRQKLQYAVTRAQESGMPRPHASANKAAKSAFSATPCDSKAAVRG